MIENWYNKLTIGGVDVVASGYLVTYRITDTRNDEYSRAIITLTPEAKSEINIDEDQEIVVTRGIDGYDEETIFRGSLVSFKDDNVYLEITAYSKEWELGKITATTTFDKDIDSEAGKISAIAETLITDFTDFTAYNFVDSGTTMVIDRFILNQDIIGERINKLREALNWQFYYDMNNDGFVFEPIGTTELGTTLQTGINILNKVVFDYDKEDMVNRLTIIGGSQEIETTESGQIGVTTGYNTTDVTLTFSPVSVKVFADAGNPATTLRAGGIENSSDDFDYIVDTQNNKIVWSDTYTPGGADFVEIRYSYQAPIKVTGQDDDSVDTHNIREGVETYKDIVTVADAIERLNERLAELVKIEKRADVMISGILGLKAGSQVEIIDTSISVDEVLVIDKVIYQFPEPYDKVELGIEKINQRDYMNNVNDRIRRLERESARNQDVIAQVVSKNRDIKPGRRYAAMETKSITDDTILIWDHPTQGNWDEENWGGDAFGSATTSKLVQGKMTYDEYGYDTDFHDSVNSTATFDTTNQRIDFTSGQVWYSEAIDIGTTLSAITVTLGTLTGTVKIEVSGDGKGTWEEVTSGVRAIFASNDGTGTYIRITEDAATTARIENTFDDFGDYTASIVRGFMEE